MTKKLKKLPKFKSEDEEREFWSTHSSMDYIDWSKAKRVTLPNLKRSQRLIPLRVSDNTYEKLNQMAKKQDIPVANIVKHFLQQGLKNAASAAHRASN